MKKRLLSSIVLAALLSVGLYAFAAPAPAAHASAPTNHTITRTSGSTASAGFHFESGDVTGDVFIEASPEGFQFSPTESFPGPAVQVFVQECNNVTTQCVFGGNMAHPTVLQLGAKKLTSATLQASVPVDLMDQTGAVVASTVVTADLTWTGVGSITSQSGNFRIRTPHLLNEMYHFKGIIRNATVSGDASYFSPLLNSTVTLMGSDVMFAQLMSSGSTSFSIQRG
ncbi:MAG TPA: hypothetical protein VF812_12080 [Ktedonobacterales bacterium]